MNPDVIQLVSDTEDYTDRDALAGVTATDVEDGDITDQIRMYNPVEIDWPRTYLVEYAVTDSGGNTVTAMRLVYVIDSTKIT